MKYNDILTNPKVSNVFSMNNGLVYTTPSGSYITPFTIFYKHQIPSGLLNRNKLKTIEANIQKELAELKELI